LDRNGLSVSPETACRFEPKSPAGNSEICKHRAAGDVVIVTGIDRLARSTFDLFAMVK
jgi:hypothetical protein